MAMSGFYAKHPYAMGATAMGAGAGQMLAPWENPYQAGEATLNNVPSTIKPYFEPYINAGNRALPSLEGNYGALASNPGAKLNEIGSNFKQSPGYQWALKQALMGVDNSEAARGMSYTPEHQQWAAQTAEGLASQDYYKWLEPALNLYGMGLGGQQGLYNTGANASKELGESLGNVELTRAIQQILGQQAENEHEGGGFGAFLGGAGAALGAFL